MDSALERLTAIVRAHHGRVLQYAGDSLLAAFGADQALEDDAERAVRAGLAILAEAPRARGRVSAPPTGSHGFDLRVGIHTGPVLLGGGIDADSSIRGISVNIAARMEQTAPAGTLRISHETYRHVRGVFDVEAQAPIEIKGITGPVRSYLVRAPSRARFRDGQPRPRGNRDADGRPRRRARAHRRDAFQGACEEEQPAPGDDRRRAGHRQEPPRPRVHALARAPARAGALLPGTAAARTATTSPTACCATCSPGASRFSRATRSRSRRPSSRRASARCSASARAEYTALIGAADRLRLRRRLRTSPRSRARRKQIRDRAFHALASYFRALHATRRHADRPPARRPALGRRRLARLRQPPRRRHCGDLPLFLLCLTRSTLYERRPLWGSGRSDHLRIDLAPLYKARHARADRGAAQPARDRADGAARPAREQRRGQPVLRRGADRHADRRRRHRHHERAVARLGRQAARRARAVDARRRPAGAHRRPAAGREGGAAAGERDRPRLLGRGAAAHRAGGAAPRSTA